MNYLTSLIEILRTLLISPFEAALHPSPEPLIVLTAVWIGFIIIFAFSTAIHFKIRKANPCRNEIKRVINVLRQFESETIADKYEDMNNDLKDDRFIGHRWREFSETLFKVRDLQGKDVMYNAVDPAKFFNMENIVSPHINLRFYATLPGILTGLGILGTFVGLSIGLSKITFFTGTVDIGNISKGIQELLSSAQLAFSTSIWGIGLSILFLIVERRTISNIEENVRDLLRSFESIFERKTSESILSEVLSESYQQTRALNTITTDLATEMAELLGQKVSQTIGPSIDKLNVAIETLAHFKEESSLEAIEKLTQEFSKSLAEGARTEFDELRQVLGNVGETLAAINQSTMEQINLTSERTTALIDSLQERSTSLSLDMAKNIEELSSTMTQRLQEVSGRFGEERGEILGLLDNFRQMIDRLESVIDSAGMAAEAFKQTADPIKEVTSQLRTSIETWHRAQSEFSEMVKNNQDYIRNQMVTSERVLEHIQNSLADTKEAWKTYEDKFGLVQEGLRTILEELDRGLRDYSQLTKESIGEYLSSLDGHTSNALKYIGGTLEELREILEGLESLPR